MSRDGGWCVPKVDGEYVPRMEDMCSTYMPNSQILTTNTKWNG